MTDIEIENCLTSDLRDMVYEWGEESATEHFSSLMLSSGLDSRIIVKVLDKFGEHGKYQSMCIKVNEGW